MLSRLSAVGLMALVIALFAGAVVQPLWARYAVNRDLIGELESQLVKFKAISNKRSALEKELVNLRVGIEQSGLLMEGESPTLASASLQDRVKQEVESAGATLASTQTLPDRSDGEFQRISVNARMMGSVAQVQASLYGLESAPPVLVVDELLIVTRRTPVRLRGGDESQDGLLDVRFQVSGFYDAGPAVR